jgi:hypothetical protein
MRSSLVSALTRAPGEPITAAMRDEQCQTTHIEETIRS